MNPWGTGAAPSKELPESAGHEGGQWKGRLGREQRVLPFIGWHEYFLDTVPRQSCIGATASNPREGL